MSWWDGLEISQPKSIDECSACLRNAHTKQLAVIPWGSGSHQGMGHPPTTTDLLVKTIKLNRILEHAVNDLTVTVETGITLGELQKRLQPAGQFFPFSHPDSENRTIGGILSTATTNLLASKYFHLRELVLGCSVIQSNGSTIKGGGRVVKNVSGYEMPKLFVGSFGTLGIIVSATLRLSPIPAQTSFIKAQFNNAYPALQALKQLYISNLILSFAIFRESKDGLILLVRVDGTPRFVTDLVQKIRTLLLKNGAVNIDESSKDDSNDLLSLASSPVCCYGFVPPSTFRNLESEIEVLSSSLGADATILFSMDGAFSAGLKGEFNQNAVDAFSILNRRIAALGGWIVYERVPEKFRRDWPMWGEERDGWEISARLKNLFDPNDILNPGRFMRKAHSTIS